MLAALGVLASSAKAVLKRFYLSAAQIIKVKVMANHAGQLIVMLGVFIAQLYLFFTVESVPMRVALALFAIFQIWQKSRKRQQQQPTAEN